MKSFPKPAGFRRYLLDSAILFTRAAVEIHGVRRVSLVGSITTDRPNPKDIDVLVMIADDAETAALAREARRLKGKAQQVNLGADVFLADDRGNYLGRTCHWKDCRPGVRSSCDARNCGRRAFVHDDLDALELVRDIILAPPVTLWPTVIRRVSLPRDVDEALEQVATLSNPALEPTAHSGREQDAPWLNANVSQTDNCKMNIGVLASHEGTTLQEVLDACADGRIPARVSVVVSNNSGSGALVRARQIGIPALHLSSQSHRDQTELDRAIRDALVAASVDLVFLAGYMKKLGPQTLQTFDGRILNTHPALLPKFGGPGMYGDRVFEATLAAGDQESGVSIHLVNADYDSGPIFRQCRVPVFLGDSIEKLKTRIRERERQLVVETLAEIAKGEIALEQAG